MNQRHPQSRPKIVQSGLRNQQMLSVCTAVVDWFGPSWPDSHLGSPHARFCARAYRYFSACYGLLGARLDGHFGTIPGASDMPLACFARWYTWLRPKAASLGVSDLGAISSQLREVEIAPRSPTPRDASSGRIAR